MNPRMLMRQLVVQERRLIVTHDCEGWEVCEHEGETIVRTTRRHDWHRVERDRLLFDLRVHPPSARADIGVRPR